MIGSEIRKKNNYRKRNKKLVGSLAVPRKKRKLILFCRHFFVFLFVFFAFVFFFVNKSENCAEIKTKIYKFSRAKFEKVKTT